MMNKLVTFRHLAVAGILCLLAASCSDVTDDGTTLPDGTYPMTFTASVDGLTATRATTDNTWTAGDEIAIQIGSEVKKHTAASGGNLTIASGNTPFYWQNATETKTVTAWYSSIYSATRPTSFTVQANQSSNGYQQSDFLYTRQAITYSSGSKAALAFKHLPTKVIVNLKNGDGVTAEEVTNATVSLVNQATASGAIAEEGTVTQTPAGNTAITPHGLTAASGCQKSVQALLVPQQMQGKQFIKVTIGAGTAARDYYYTPTNGTDANLEAGEQYTYTITVKKTGLEVTVTNNGTSWTDTPAATTPDASVTFQITAPEGVAIAAASGSDGSLTDNGNGSYTLSNGNAVSITATSIYIKNIKGLYEVADDGTTYTLQSDLLITGYTLADARVGDFYCKSSDGSTGYLIPGDIASLTTEQQAACIGIVYSTDPDRIGARATQALNEKGVSTPHGLVMALTNASDGCRWGDYGKDENSGGNDGEPFKANTDQLKKQYENVDGYGETHWIIETYGSNGNTALQNTYTAFYHASRYGTADSSTEKYTAPTNTTGWFIPGMGQWWDILSNLGKIDLTSYRDKTGGSTSISGAANTAVANINKYLQKISGATPFSTGTYFWSSSEYNGYYACLVGFDSYGNLGLGYNLKYYSSSRVRCSFAF